MCGMGRITQNSLFVAFVVLCLPLTHLPDATLNLTSEKLGAGGVVNRSIYLANDLVLPE